MTDKIQELIVEYSATPNDPLLNFGLGLAYLEIGQTASAISFFLRTAEKSDSVLLRYEALLKCGLCFNLQGSRNATTRGLFQNAVSIMPDRPEAYYFLSCIHERAQEWQEAYMMACIGLGTCDFIHDDLRTDIGYPGKFALLFQKAVPAWWVGMCTQSREILVDLQDNYEMDELHTGCVASNLAAISIKPTAPPIVTKYDITEFNKLRYKFNGVENIGVNHAQSYQDLFVLSMLDGKRNGTYLELGSAYPFYNNNTALLETNFDWKGISIDYNNELTDQFFKERSNTVFCMDATKADFGALLSMTGLETDIDYLQLDCDPAPVTLEVLKRIPFDIHRFAVITFEHDHYTGQGVRKESRRYLKSKGYTLVASDIAHNETGSYEDWWAHPELVDSKIIDKMKDTSRKPKFCKDYMLPN